jgi:hypothetical protein
MSDEDDYRSINPGRKEAIIEDAILLQPRRVEEELA